MELFRDIKLMDDEICLEIYELRNENEDGDNPPTYRLNIKTNAENKVVGRCSFRVGNSSNRHIKYGGNVGYDVDKPHRGNKYSLKACRLLLLLANSHRMKSVTITCAPENMASRRICELLGANLVSILDLPKDDYNYINHGTTQHYVYEIAVE